MRPASILTISLYLPLFILILVQGCSDNGNGTVFETTFNLRNASGQDLTRFANGEPITFVLSVTNLTDTSQRITLPSSQQYDFLVLQGHRGPILWQWSHGKGFLTVITELQFAPHETKTFSEIWDQKNNNGDPVGPGNLEAEGFFLTLEALAAFVALTIQ